MALPMNISTLAQAVETNVVQQIATVNKLADATSVMAARCLIPAAMTTNKNHKHTGRLNVEKQTLCRSPSEDKQRTTGFGMQRLCNV